MISTTSSSKAQNRELAVWFQKIKNGEIKLPRFQRFEAWDRNRIKGFMNTIIHNLPVGVALVLEVGDNERFQSRYLKTATPDSQVRVLEHVLDGQQRLTAFWRVIHNNYRRESFYVYVPEFDRTEDSIRGDEVFIYCQPRWYRNNRRYPLWADNSRDCFRRGLIPTKLLQPGDISHEIDGWIDKATKHLRPKSGSADFESAFERYAETKQHLRSVITSFREIVTHFNLPYLALPAPTPKETALRVFINMNTNSKPLSLYDIIVAEVESVRGESLHQLQERLEEGCPKLRHYGSVSQLLLATSALLQDKVANERGMIEMDKAIMLDKWQELERGLGSMTDFMERQRVYDRQRLPTGAVLSVIAALYSVIPDGGDMRGRAETLLKKYVWSAFFTERYENSAATRAFADYRNLKRVLVGAKKEDGTLFCEKDVLVLNREEYPLLTVDELIGVGWPKRQTIPGRGILAVTSYLGAYDFADGRELTRDNLRSREYHHIFPDALLEEAGEYSYFALNCALISGKTNRDIGRKDPLTYLQERYEWTSREIIHQRLGSHLLPIPELANGGYEGLNEIDRAKKIRRDYRAFLNKRAELVSKAVKRLASGEHTAVPEILKDTDSLAEE